MFRNLEKLHSLTPIQIKYYKDNHRFAITSAGRRSRKTLISMRKLFIRALLESNIEHGRRYFHGAPTRSQAKQIFWKRLKIETKPFWIKAPSESELIVFLIRGIEIHVVGLDKPERVEGTPWHGGHITEMGNTKAGIWGEHIRPLFSDTNGWCMIDGVPEGENHYYDLALYAAGGAIPETESYIGAFAEFEEWAFFSWFSADVLTEAEIKAAKQELDVKTFNREYKGAFTSYQGKAYYNFSNKNLKMVQYQKGKYVHIGIDFNVDPMTAVFLHIDSDEISQFGEAYLINSNTREMVEHIKDLFPVGECVIYPDCTGAARSTTATKTAPSDIAILKNAGFTVKAHKANPHVKDRLDSVNCKIKTADEKIHYYVNPEECPKTINDLNRVERLPDGRENKEQEKLGLVHISSALGYPVTYLFPIRRGEYMLV